MTAKDQYIQDLNRVQKKLNAARNESNEWWNAKKLQDQVIMAWNQSGKWAGQVEGTLELKDLEERHEKFYTYATLPYRSWIDEGFANIDKEVGTLFENKPLDK